jgi:hypothetical protein
MVKLSVFPTSVQTAGDVFVPLSRVLRSFPERGEPAGVKLQYGIGSLSMYPSIDSSG